MAHKHWQTWVKVAFIPLALFANTVADFTECQRPCDCRWQSGNKAAVCTNSSLKTIPANLSSDIQILDLTGNNLQILHQEAFKRVGLSNLKKLFLKECNIETVHKAAFVTLAIMIELDLSKNRIKHLYPDIFRGTEKLRLINLSNNHIEKLEDGLFRNLKFLQKVEVSNNWIVRIGTKAFINLPQLKILRFDGNKLSHMKPETLMSLRNLSGLDLHNNPWRCDCNLQSFRDWAISHNLYTPPTACAEPEAVKDKLWNELDSSNFACRPTILEPLPDSTVRSYDENITLTCKVVGNPTPEVVWRYNGRTIELKAFGEIRYAVSENTVDLIRFTNLTIINARYSDRGNYTCIAENPGGRDEKTLMLVLSKFGSAGAILGMDTDTLAILVGCTTAVLVIAGAIFGVCYCTAQTSDLKRLIKTDTRSSNGDVLMDSVSSETEKRMKTEINPVVKPPRKYDPPPSVTSEATEMSELNRTLLDSSDSILASTEDNSRHLEVELPKISRETLLIDRLTQDCQDYPPDLLSFPLKGITISPASGIETDSILRPHISSPSKNQSYGVVTNGNLALYTKLQASGFQGSLPVMNPKGGYVTLPRRPKNQEHTQVFSSINGVIPHEFNMKLFSHGGNYSSLNKSEIELGPIHKLSDNFDSQEFEPAPSPAPGTPHATIPRNSLSSPNIHNQLLMLQSMSLNAQGKIPRPSEQTLTVMTDNSDLKDLRDKLRYVNVSGTISGTVRTRIAPKPPPKQRKRVTTVTSDVKEFLNTPENATQV